MKKCEFLEKDHEIHKKRYNDSITENERLAIGLKVFEEEIKSLQQTINKTSAENSENKSKIEFLSVKNSEINAKLSETITDKEEFVLSLSSQLRILEQEKVEFQGTIESKDLEIQDLERKLSVFIQENNYFKQKLEESQTELEKFLEVHQNHQILLKDLKDNQTELKHKNEVLVNENKSLKLKISDLEEKNREVFENLEKDLNQRAKDYKKRTMDILNMQRSHSQNINPSISLESYENNRSRISYMRPNTPYDRFDDKYENDSTGNAAGKLLLALDKSPTTTRTQVSKTPTKENIKARIAVLLQNRSKIEAELNKFDN